MTPAAAINFADIQAAAEHLQAASDERCRRVGVRLGAWITGELDTVDRALGLAGPGHHSNGTRHALARRDDLERQVASWNRI